MCPCSKTGIAVSKHVETQAFPELTCTGGVCLVAWQDYRSGKSYDIYATRVK